MSRTLDALQLLGVLASGVLFWAAAVAPAAVPPRIAVDVGDMTTLRSGEVAWPVSLRMLGGQADVYLAVRVDGLPGHPNDLRVTRCDSSAESARSLTCGRPIGREAVFTASGTGIAHLGRIGTLDPGEQQQLLAIVGGVDRTGTSPSIRVNATPCTPARTVDLWTVQRTRPDALEPTMRTTEQCAVRRSPWLPLGLVVWTSTLALRFVVKRNEVRA